MATSFSPPAPLRQDPDEFLTALVDLFAEEPLRQDPDEFLTALVDLFAEEPEFAPASAAAGAAALHGRRLSPSTKKNPSPGNPTTYAVWGSKPKPHHGTRHAPSGGMASLLPYRQIGLPQKAITGIIPTMRHGECVIPKSALKAEPEVLDKNMHLAELYSTLSIEYGLIQNGQSRDRKVISRMRAEGVDVRKSIEDLGGSPLVEPIHYWKSTYPKAFPKAFF